ncbi:hypothetical protein [Paenibacillus chungangensis]|uniref:Uncharacterized protein n=1 Tax=Paenibacillus chungangensis TaxID=696535 RepID=A0ABW3HNF0_9BACL
MSEKVVYYTDRANAIVSWQVRGNMTVEDAIQASTSIKEEVERFPEKEVSLLVDNRYMVQNGRPIVFSADVTKVWNELQIYLIPKVSKVAVLCSSMMMKMQMDRVAKESGLISSLKSFYNNDLDVSAKEAYAFLGTTHNKLIDEKFPVS